MPSTTEVAQAVEAWAAEVQPQIHTYPDEPASIEKDFPLVIADVQRDAVGPSPQELRKRGYEQVPIRMWRVRMILAENPEPPWTAMQSLYAIVDALGAALRRDETLGQRVQFALPYYETDYTPAEITFPDGTEARAATMTINVGEQVEV